MGVEGMRPNDLPYWGLDRRLEDRPGVPREATPHPLPGAHWKEPERQPVEGPVLMRPGLTRPTPVFNTALPPKGVSGALRRAAYKIPDHRVRHWLILMLADRVDVVQNLPSWFMRKVAGPGGRRGPASRGEQRRADEEVGP